MRYLIGFFVTIGLLILLIVLLFSSNNSSSSTKQVPNSSKALTSYATSDAEVRLTVDGPVSADQTHQQFQITVDQNNASYNLYQGYEQQAVKSQNYANNQASFNNFLHALQLNGFTLGNTASSLKDEKGYCAEGDRYVFELIQDGKDIERFWATSCGGTHTYNGATSETLDLFRAQIPDFDNLNSSTDLNI